MTRFWMCLVLCLLARCIFDARGLSTDPQLAVLPVPCGPSNTWVMLGDACLMLGDVSKNWTEAREVCRGFNSDLASFPASRHAEPLIYMLSEHCGSVAVAGNGTHSFLDWKLRLCSLTYLYPLCMTVDSQAASSSAAMTFSKPTILTTTPQDTQSQDSSNSTNSDLPDSSTPSPAKTSLASVSTPRTNDLTSEQQDLQTTVGDGNDGHEEVTSEIPPVTSPLHGGVPSSEPSDDVAIADVTSAPPCSVLSLNCVDKVLDSNLPVEDKIHLLSLGVLHDTAWSGSSAVSWSQNATADDSDIDWRRRIQYFFWVLNKYLERSHNGQQNRTLEEVLFTLDDFLGDIVNLITLNETIKGNYSYVEFQLANTASSELSRFTYRDTEAACNISHVDFAGRGIVKKHEKTVLVTVLMHIPDMVAILKYDEQVDDGIIPGPVLLLSGFVNGRRQSLTHSFTLPQRFKYESPNNTYCPHCVYLDTISGMWSTYGCERDARAEDGVTGCRCNHTSNFAVLMQIVPFELSEAHKVALSIITYIGCSITLITQFMAITVFTCVGSLNCERVCVHRNLCLAIVGAQVTFLAGIEAVQDRLVCAIVAVLLHYFYTAVFIWMLVEGLHLYSKVVRVFGTEKSRMLYYVCFGWGVPLVLVTISAAVDWAGYGTPTSCWLSTQRNTIWAFVGPALAIMIVNLVILAAVIRIVMASAKLDKHGEFDHIRAGVKAAFLLLPLLGLTWVFGLAAVNEQLVVFQYLFALFNTLQGFFIFLFHCAFNSEVRQALKRLQEKRSLQRGDLSSLAGLSTSPSVSPVPSVQEQKKPYGRGDSTSDLSSAYKVNRVVPAGYTSTTNIGNTTIPTMATKTARGDRRRSSAMEASNKTQESLMFI